MNGPSASIDQPAERILVRGVNWLGDAVMTTPALLRLREARPNARITLLTHEKLADLWQRHPALDSVFTVSSGEGAWSVARKIRAGNFQVGIAFPNSIRSALELWLGGVPRRVGYGSSGRSWLLTHCVPRPEGFARMRKRSASEIQRLIRSSIPPSRQSLLTGAHQIHHYLHLVAALGANPVPIAPRLAVSEAEVIAVGKKFLLPGDKPLLGLNPGAEYGPAKRWPTERFIEAAVALQAAVNCRWLILGGGGDSELAATIEAELKQRAARIARDGPINLTGRTSLRELCAAIKACRVLLTNDTGPMHVAAAVDTPVVAIFGSTSTELTAPGLPGDSRHRLLTSDVPCSPCYRRECPIDFRCMHGVTVEAVVQAALEVWRDGQ